MLHTLYTVFAIGFVQSGPLGQIATQKTPEFVNCDRAGFTRGIPTRLRIRGKNLSVSQLISYDPMITVSKPVPESAEALVTTLSSNATMLPGPKLFRLANSAGLSKPFVLWADVFPTVVRPNVETYAVGPDSKTIESEFITAAERQVTTFTAKAGERWIFDITAGRIGSEAVPRIDLLDPTGKQIETATTDGISDARINYVMESDGIYSLAITSAAAHFVPHAHFRLTLGKLPVLKTYMPHGERAGRVVQMIFESQNSLGAARGSMPIPADAPEGPIMGTVRTPLGFTLTFPFLVDNDPVASITESDALMPLPLLPGSLEGWFQVYPRIKFFFPAKAGESFLFDFFASRIGSVVEGELEITDEFGHRLAFSRAAHGEDASLKFTAGNDGNFTIIASNLSGKLGPDCTYRIKCARQLPEFRIKDIPEFVVGKSSGLADIPFSIDRSEGFDSEIRIQAQTSSKTAPISEIVLPANTSRAKLSLKLPTAKSDMHYLVRIVGVARTKNGPVQRSGIISSESRAVKIPDIIVFIPASP